MTVFRTVSVLGATGSVGRTALKLLAQKPEEYRIAIMVAGRDALALARLARAHGAGHAVLADPDGYVALKEHLSGSGITCAAGPQAVLDAVQHPVDIAVAAIIGAAGMRPTLTAAAHCKILALANKESVVCGGQVFMDAVAASGATLIPVDSEHNALFQLFADGAGVDKGRSHVTLAASGGPFRDTPLAGFAALTPEQAMRHPVWPMGGKISIDSATLMNKALEVIEAHYLFAVPPEQIRVLIHPQAVVHVISHYNDGSSFMHCSIADMAVPLGYALAYPRRWKGAAATLDFTARDPLRFEAVDAARFPCLSLAYTALRQGAGTCVALNAANEIAVQAFCGRILPFTGIYPIVETVLAGTGQDLLYSLNDIEEMDAWARRQAETALKEYCRKTA